MAQEIKMSAAGLKAMQEELEYLKTVRRKELAEEIKEARSHGDLSENSEYDEAKNTQGLVERREPRGPRPAGKGCRRHRRSPAAHRPYRQLQGAGHHPLCKLSQAGGNYGRTEEEPRTGPV